jgi:small subunit ribosomal protein S16
MPLVIRMSQTGRTNRPFFRVGVYDQRTRRDGPPVEALGWYDPKATEAEKQFSIKAERVAHWFSKGASVSDTVKTFLRRKGIEVPKVKTARDTLAKDAARRERSAAKRGPAKPAKPAKKA